MNPGSEMPPDIEPDAILNPVPLKESHQQGKYGARIHFQFPCFFSIRFPKIRTRILIE